MIQIIRAALAANQQSISALARHLGVTPAAIHQWRRIPAERVLEVERFLGVPRHELRPDLYPTNEGPQKVSPP